MQEPLPDQIKIALSELAESPSSLITPVLARFAEKFERRDATWEVRTGPSVRSLTDVEVESHLTSSGRVPYAKINVSPRVFERGYGPMDVKADLVRTMFVTDQLPDKGYQRRLVGVYTTALDLQADWLQGQNAESVYNDPRTNAREELLRKLLGDRFYLDAGIEDWSPLVADNLKRVKRTSGEDLHEDLENWAHNIGEPLHFIYWRERHRGTIRQQMRHQRTFQEFIGKNADERASFFARQLFSLRTF